MGRDVAVATMFEAALNLLREELRAVTAARRAIMSDRDLAAEDPRHRQQLLTQTMAEIGQHSRAIHLLERVASGDLVEMDMPDPVAMRPFVPSAGEVRDHGLFRRPPNARASGGPPA